MIADLKIDKGWTLDEIKAQLVKLGQGHISRSALGRHVRGLLDVGAELRETQIYAEALAKETGGASQGQMIDLNAQLLQNNMFKLMLAEHDGEGIQLSSKEAKEFSEALRNLALTRKTEQDVIEKAEKRAADKATRAAAEAVGKVAKRFEGGFTKDMIDAVKREILKAG